MHTKKLKMPPPTDFADVFTNEFLPAFSLSLDEMQ